MKLIKLSLILVLSCICFQIQLPAETASADDFGETASPDFPQITCTSTDPALTADIFDLAVEARHSLSPLLQIPVKTWRFPIDFHIVTDEDPLASKIKSAHVTVITDGNTLKIITTISSHCPELKEIVQRQLVTALLWERFFAHTTTFDQNTNLEVIPFWLREGIRENLTADMQNDQSEIVLRAALAHRAPDLADIQRWHQFDDDSLLGIWQRAFCHYLFRSMTRDEQRVKDFQAWLSALIDPDPSLPASAYFLTESAWQKEIGNASNQDRSIVYTWDKTLTELAAAQPITLTGSKPSETKLTTLDQISEIPYSPNLRKDLQPHITQLIILEARAHPSWRDIIALYRQSLIYLTDQKSVQLVGPTLNQAKKIREEEILYHQKLLDYINWFEVNRDYSGTTSSFDSYFRIAAEMDKAQADTANPIRSDLLKLETHF